MSDSTWKTRAEEDMGVRLTQWQTLSGGDFAQSYAASVSAVDSRASNLPHFTIGQRIFIKTHANPPPEHFTTEARGLQWLSDTNTVQVPTVLGVSDEIPYLALIWIEETRQAGGAEHRHTEREFGRQLAALHTVPLDRFGRRDSRPTGSLSVPNSPSFTWADFYATQRLLPLARIASDRQALSASTVGDIERVAQRLSEWVDDEISASLLHGDLWAGNRLVDINQQSWVIDPACHGGHREFDLAMMSLFGGYAPECFDAYQEASALDDGWQQRVSLHQLAPLIVHCIKFGASYVQPTKEALARYV